MALRVLLLLLLLLLIIFLILIFILLLLSRAGAGRLVNPGSTELYSSGGSGQHQCDPCRRQEQKSTQTAPVR